MGYIFKVQGESKLKAENCEVKPKSTKKSKKSKGD